MSGFLRTQCMHIWQSEIVTKQVFASESGSDPWQHDSPAHLAAIGGVIQNDTEAILPKTDFVAF